MTNNSEIVQCLNIIKTDNGSIKLIGKTFEKKMVLYENLADSSIFDIYTVDALSNVIKFWDYLEKKNDH